MEEKYSFVVPQKALIKKGNKFLIIKRSLESKSYPNHWDLPGGKLEHGESLENGLKREVKEETNLQIKILKPVASYIETKKIYAYLVVYNCKLLSGKIKLSHEHSEYKWATKKEILELIVEPYLKKMIKEKIL